MPQDFQLLNLPVEQRQYCVFIVQMQQPPRAERIWSLRLLDRLPRGYFRHRNIFRQEHLIDPLRNHIVLETFALILFMIRQPLWM